MSLAAVNDSDGSPWLLGVGKCSVEDQKSAVQIFLMESRGKIRLSQLIWGKQADVWIPISISGYKDENMTVNSCGANPPYKNI